VDKKFITYEQPLNERIRLFLRLEYLFQQVDWSLQGESQWHNRTTLSALVDILEILARADVKTELLKYLEKLTANLSRLHNNSAVDKQQLAQILAQLEESQQNLFGTSGQVGQALRDHHMISSILQRKTVSAGTSHVDLPLYHAWLQRPADERSHTLQSWFDELAIVRKPIKLTLELIRTSIEAQACKAEQGFYQSALDPNRAIQMIRVFVAADVPCYAEISGGKHRVSVRFMVEHGAERPTQTDTDIEFHMSCCAL